MALHKKILIAAGGTGGHLFPAVAVAKKLKEKLGDKIEFEFFGRNDKIEGRVIPQLGYKLHNTKLQGVSKKISLATLKLPFQILFEIYKLLKIIKSNKIDAVLCTGAYISIPPGLAAKLSKKKLFLMESNVNLGKANNFLAAIANLIFTSFEETKFFLKKTIQNKVKLTGNPVRQEILETQNRTKALQKFALQDVPTVLIFGGSLGAKAINESVLKHLDKFAAAKYQIIWQSGKMHEFQTKLPKNVKLLDFIDDMAAAYSLAELVVSRSGATTIAELCAIGKPAILIPLPSAANNEQLLNAKVLEKSNAAIVLNNSEIADKLFEIVDKLMKDSENLQNMGKAALSLGKLEASEIIAKEIENAINLN